MLWKQEVQGIQVFAFCVVNLRYIGSEENIGVKFKDVICPKLCLKLWFESDWYFCNIFFL